MSNLNFELYGVEQHIGKLNSQFTVNFTVELDGKQYDGFLSSMTCCTAIMTNDIQNHELKKGFEHYFIRKDYPITFQTYDMSEYAIETIERELEEYIYDFEKESEEKHIEFCMELAEQIYDGV